MIMSLNISKVNELNRKRQPVVCSTILKLQRQKSTIIADRMQSRRG